VRVAGRRRGSDVIERAEFTMERATKAGYVGQNAKYKTDPRAMLYARAISILCRRLAPEVLKGIAAVEEVNDEPDGTTPTGRTRSVQRAVRPELADPVAAPQQAPSGPPLPGEGPADGSVTTGISEKQWRDINAMFVRLGVTGPGQTEKRLAVLSELADRTIHRGSELTGSEATAILDTLTGNGAAVVAEILAGPPAYIAPSAAEQAAPPLPGEDEVDGTVEDDDPTTADDWGMDGAEAEGEAL
jgi:hypothetical protein